MFFFGLVKPPFQKFPFFCWVGLPYYSQRTKWRVMNYATFRIYCLCLVGVCFSACSPQSTLSRLLKNHPYLYENFRHDSIRIENVLVQDSVFFFTKEKDTITFNNATIYREFDTLRLIQSCPPCTTYVSKTILQPTQKLLKETRYKRSLREKLEDSIFPIIIGLLLGLIITRRG